VRIRIQIRIPRAESDWILANEAREDGVVSLVDLLDRAAERFGDAPALSAWGDNGLVETWSYRTLQERSRNAAAHLGLDLALETGDRLLVWGAPSPALAAVIFGAIRAGVVLVPLDLRMSPEAIQRIAESSSASAVAIGDGVTPDALAGAGLGNTPRAELDSLVRSTAAPLSPSAERAAQRGHCFEVVYTSGATGHPKGAVLNHGAILTWVAQINLVIRPRRHRIVSVLPLSHIFGQLTELFYALSVGSHVTYVHSRSPKTIFAAMQATPVTSLVLVPAALDLFWSGLLQEVDRRGRRRQFEVLRAIARRLPMRARRVVFRSVHARLGGSLQIIISAAAALPPALHQAWEDLGIMLLEGYGATECGMIACETETDHPTGTVGRPIVASSVSLGPDGEVLVGGPGLFSGYWRDDAATREVLGADGLYRTGDYARVDGRGRLVLLGRKKNRIVLPDGMKVYPEDLEAALRAAGARDAVVAETLPGRLEAAVIVPEQAPGAAGPDGGAELVRRANRVLGVHQRISAVRSWPDADFPRTHTLKVRREPVVTWLRSASSTPTAAEPVAQTA
jgi:long-chain acyl-CoA synthetase